MGFRWRAMQTFWGGVIVEYFQRFYFLVTVGHCWPLLAMFGYFLAASGSVFPFSTAFSTSSQKVVIRRHKQPEAQKAGQR